MEEELTAREDNRTGEDSREETAELGADWEAEVLERLGDSLGIWVMAWTCDLTVGRGCGCSLTSPSLADRCAGSDATSAFLAPLDCPEAPLRQGGLSDSAVMVSTESDCADELQTSQETREEAWQLGRNEVPKRESKK